MHHQFEPSVRLLEIIEGVVIFPESPFQNVPRLLISEVLGTLHSILDDLITCIAINERIQVAYESRVNYTTS